MSTIASNRCSGGTRSPFGGSGISTQSNADPRRPTACPVSSTRLLFAQEEAAGGATLEVQDADIALAAENVALEQANTLVVQDATVGLSTDAIALTQQNTLAVADATVALAADNVTLEGLGATLAVQDATIGLSSDPVALEQANTLVVQDATVALAAAAVALEATEPPAAPVHNYDVPPQGFPSEGRGGRRRRALSKALAEALEQPDEEERDTGRPAKKRRKAKPTIQASEPERPAEAQARAIGKAPEDRTDLPTAGIQKPLSIKQPPPPPTVVGDRGALRGERLRATYGTLAASAGGEGNVKGARYGTRHGIHQPYAVENPTTEFLIVLLTAA